MCTLLVYVGGGGGCGSNWLPIWFEIPRAHVVDRSRSQVGLLGHLSDFWVHVPGGRFTCVHATLVSLGSVGRLKVAYNCGIV